LSPPGAGGAQTGQYAVPPGVQFSACRRWVGLRLRRVQMFDDSKRLDKLEADMSNVVKFHDVSNKNFETINKFIESATKNFENLVKYQDSVGKDILAISKNFQDVWKRLDALEKSMKAVEAKVKKIK
jgi:hypothetical protein